VQRLKAVLLAEPDVVVTNVTLHKGYEALEPGEKAARRFQTEEPWRHVAVLLVGDVDNATLGGLRYARSLEADDLHCVHVSIDNPETERVLAEWKEAVPRLPLEILDSPYRQITGVISQWVRDVLERKPRTFVTLVIPELVVGRPWHNLLHSKTSLLLKGLFLFEPSVVVSAVPYKLDLSGDRDARSVDRALHGTPPDPSPRGAHVRSKSS
ncbi:MAG: hypothetical protein M3164_00035, partial [Actinomycetota bacterium]|nr:hypothetical protein [Actinomycetota bacterium]